MLQQENVDLKESLKEHQSVLEYIMTKYREQMLKLIQIKREQEMAEDFYKNNLTQVNFTIEHYIYIIELFYFIIL